MATLCADHTANANRSCLLPPGIGMMELTNRCAVLGAPLPVHVAPQASAAYQDNASAHAQSPPRTPGQDVVLVNGQGGLLNTTQPGTGQGHVPADSPGGLQNAPSNDQAINVTEFLHSLIANGLIPEGSAGIPDDSGALEFLSPAVETESMADGMHDETKTSVEPHINSTPTGSVLLANQDQGSASRGKKAILQITLVRERRGEAREGKESYQFVDVEGLTVG
ncbi:hypothetical protein M427DRAFT_147736 [Gonapodya prolifera JEL478]|uniref:Uncharacterized protein n=1 Tax=Gonapodya prolifera (strain JEL478) TaxID=1344416 RepID=A0A139A5A0_GONPJ|nr:hypothetical protein M427DRAFT_147736 [Gonapodya prolifera JEL478]|eukprot:KXS11563.1 hypothetical protein M427DRAFT_147736 [Gonapodya prolifera JEL478]